MGKRGKETEDFVYICDFLFDQSGMNGSDYLKHSFSCDLFLFVKCGGS